MSLWTPLWGTRGECGTWGLQQSGPHHTYQIAKTMLGRADKDNTDNVPWGLRTVLLSGLGSFGALLMPAPDAGTSLASLAGVMVLTVAVHPAGSYRQSMVQRPT